MFAIEWDNLAMMIFVVGSLGALVLGLSLLDSELSNLEALVVEVILGTTLALYILRLQKKAGKRLDEIVNTIDERTATQEERQQARYNSALLLVIQEFARFHRDLRRELTILDKKQDGKFSHALSYRKAVKKRVADQIDQIRKVLDDINAVDNPRQRLINGLLKEIEALFDENQTPLFDESSCSAWISYADNVDRMVENYTTADKPKE